MRSPPYQHTRHVLMGMFLGLAGVFASLVVTIQNNDKHFSASLVEASAQETLLTAESVNLAVERRRELLDRTIAIDFVDDVTGTITTWSFRLSDFPGWVMFQNNPDGTMVGIHRERLKQHVISYPPEGIPLPRSCTITKHIPAETKGVERVETDCIAQSGYRYDVDVVTDAIVKAANEGSDRVSITLEKISGFLLDPEKSPEKPLVLLSTGRSNFKGSAGGRKDNVRKALNERQHNVLIPANTTFSFNDTLGVVSLSKGWKMALTIFEGANLRPAPGGGICQASTTVFRAAFNAGLPIVKQKNHSLYVTYYEAYGVGLDATIFPGRQDMQFYNDTGGSIVLQSYTVDDEAYVHVYGYDDGRSVEVSGPYFARDTGILDDEKNIRSNEIVWRRTVVENDGEVQRDVIKARYKVLPRNLPAKWTASTTRTRIGSSNVALSD